MRNIFLSASLILMMTALVSCQRDRTNYVVEYCVDNTEIQSEYFKVFEVQADGTINGKWRGDFHDHYDTVLVDGQQRIYASGVIHDAAREGCTGLEVMLDGVVNNLHGWKLDTVFQLQLGHDNYFTITPDMVWKDTWEE